MNSMSTIAPTNTAMRTPQLPTRVSNACDRCRRQKQRCDNSQPCSNCARATRECMRSTGPPSANKLVRTNHPSIARPLNLTRSQNPSKRARRATSNPHNYQNVSQAEASRENSSPDPEPPSDINTVPPSPVRSQTVRPSMGRTPTSTLSDHSWREQSFVAEFGSSSSAMDITRRVLQSRGSPPAGGRPTHAIPGGDRHARSGPGGAFHTIADHIGFELPEESVTNALIDAYFFTVHWFSLVVYEPTFRRRYHEVMSTGKATRADRPFLLLLVMILAMSCHYGKSVISTQVQASVDLNSLRSKYIKVVRQSFMDLLDEDCLEFVQICTLLGSYWLYWGKPRSSFTILGAAIKAAQSISLHRQASWYSPNVDFHIVEERKRVWWTIYTWDRFATIVYGRPLGIQDRDCDVQMPATFLEQIVDLRSSTKIDVELSPYQTQLNSVYQIASPLLENIYGIRGSSDTSLFDMAETVSQIDRSMQAWHSRLPGSLNIDNSPDLQDDSTVEEQMHQLQSLSLQLTYLNLEIIIHRPLLADWSQRRNRPSRAQSVHEDSFLQQPQLTPREKELYDSSFQKCLTASLGISHLERRKPKLVRLAGKTHLLSFLAMNIFTSSVVLHICALSDVLSDAAQEAKRGISCNLRLLRSLSTFGSLSSQCSLIIEDLIQMILEKERDHMLLAPGLMEKGAGENDHDLTDADAGYDLTHELADSQAQAAGVGANLRRSSVYIDSNSEMSRAQATATLEQTMERMQRVLKDTSQSRMQQRGEPQVHWTAMDDSASSSNQQSWTTQWPDNAHWDMDAQLLGGDTQTQDMGQFWLWEIGPNNMDIAGDTNVNYDLP